MSVCSWELWLCSNIHPSHSFPDISGTPEDKLDDGQRSKFLWPHKHVFMINADFQSTIIHCCITQEKKSTIIFPATGRQLRGRTWRFQKSWRIFFFTSWDRAVQPLWKKHFTNTSISAGYFCLSGNLKWTSGSCHLQIGGCQSVQIESISTWCSLTPGRQCTAGSTAGTFFTAPPKHSLCPTPLFTNCGL